MSGGLYPVTYMGTPLKKRQRIVHIFFRLMSFVPLDSFFLRRRLGLGRPWRSELPEFNEPHKPPAALPLSEGSSWTAYHGHGQNATDWTSDIILTRHINHREIDKITRRSWNGKHSIIV